jgi:hypothetical protein
MDGRKLIGELHNAQSPSQKEAAEEKIRREFSSLSATDKKLAKATFTRLLDEQLPQTATTLKEIDLTIELAEISQYISLSAVAKSYFGKSKEWLYQRVKGYKVNGKPASFNANERQTLSQALKDISRKVYQTSLRIS